LIYKFRLPFKATYLKTTFLKQFAWVTFFLFIITISNAQQITGIWKGKVKSANIELKIIKSGDSLTGSAYYYQSKTNYRHYSIRGYFDPETNDVIWWDDVLLDGKGPMGNSASAEPLLSAADFNCPGEDKMLLDGNSSQRDNKDVIKGPIHLQKINNSSFPDEWDWVIDNYTAGTNDPYVIDSITQLVAGPRYFPEEKLPEASTAVNTIEAKKETPKIKAPAIKTEAQPVAKKLTTNEEKFTNRQNKLQMVIPVTSSFIELRFYDNAAIDGDSIAIFLNGKVVREHILLGGEPQTIKINADELQEDNELVVVAENLGSIPPNTSYLVAIVGKKQYEARLFADEGTSALIRLVRPKAKE
jgi:hypothetical protein